MSMKYRLVIGTALLSLVAGCVKTSDVMPLVTPCNERS